MFKKYLENYFNCPYDCLIKLNAILTTMDNLMIGHDTLGQVTQEAYSFIFLMIIRIVSWPF